MYVLVQRYLDQWIS